jgi:glycerate kinase
MKILVAFNSFKKTYSSKEINEGLCNFLIKKGFDVNYVNVSDGGDGFLDCFEGLRERKIWVCGPFYQTKVKTKYLFNSDKAYIEIANICGLKLLKEEELKPLYATSYGVGEVLKDCFEEKFKRIYIGLGGTSTSDGGFGMARALGIRFYDENGREIENSIYGLLKLKKIDFSNFKKPVSEVFAVVDVRNKLLGKNGSARVFAPQKGADKNEVLIIEKALKNLTICLKKETGIDISKIEGGASAGGLGAGIYGFLGGKIIFGSDFIIKEKNIEFLIKNSDVIITGEGKFDKTSFFKKMPGEIIKIANKYGKKVILVSVFNEYPKKIKNVYFITLSKKYSITDTTKNLKRIIKKEILGFIKNEIVIPTWRRSKESERLEGDK